MSKASPFVIGRQLCMPTSRRPFVLGVFSSHWAAVAALVRLQQPAFRSLGGDKPEDLAAEVGLAEKIAQFRVDHPNRQFKANR